jgi:glycopeptide antibiotics resistance protein
VDSRIIQYWRIYNDKLPWLLSALLFTSLVFIAIYWISAKSNPKSKTVRITLIDLTISYGFIMIGFFTLMPTPINFRNLIDYQISLGLHSLGDIETIINLLMYIPLGIFICIRLKGNVFIPILIGCAYSLLIEMLQYVLPLGRIATVDDLILNTLGTIIGVFLSKLLLSAISNGVDNYAKQS